MECEHAFREMNESIKLALVTQLPVDGKPFDIEVDASNQGCGSVLLRKRDLTITGACLSMTSNKKCARSSYNVVESSAGPIESLYIQVSSKLLHICFMTLTEMNLINCFIVNMITI